VKFGPVPPKRLPKQDSQKVMLMAERHQRAAWAQQQWAETAKRCFDFFEGRHYTAGQLASLRRQKRPHLKWNMIAPLVRLVLGYFGNNRTDITFSPDQDSLSSEQTADVLTKLEMSIRDGSMLQFVDPEVFLDGLIGGRGYFDSRLNFDNNDLGEIITKARDPFATYVDPDCDTYDLNESAGFVQTAKMVSIDEIEASFGPAVSGLIKPYTMGQTPLAPLSSALVDEEISPVRTFGNREDAHDWFDQYFALAGDFVDTYRKNIRVIETQHKVSEQRNVFIDLETGDKKVIPEDWGKDKIEKAILFAQSVQNPVVVERRLVQRVQFTTTIADMIVYDAPSFYDGYTITGFFPYFRRGTTRGMVEDLIDPQVEKNKAGNARIEIVSKTANGGWLVHQDALTPKERRKLEQFGSAPGVIVTWKGDADKKPGIVDAAGNPLKYERLEKSNDEVMGRIAGINESALGELDRVQSGRAIEARTRQAVLSVQVYTENFKRSKMLLGKRHLDIIQNHYTQTRMFRILGEDSKTYQKLVINEQMQDPSTGVLMRILNDVTLGKYVAKVDTAPMSATFQQGQWEDAIEILTKLGPAGQQIMPAVVDLLIDMSQMPRKDEWISRIQQALGAAQQQQQQQAGGQPGAPQPQPQQQPAPQPGA
jgi:hypothetical protein